MKTSHKKFDWLPDFVYGGIDGAVTTFAVVAGVAGAQLSTAIVLILGFANLFADGFSMAVSKYSSDRAEKERIHSVRCRLDELIHDDPEGQKKALEKIFKKRGFKGKDLQSVLKVTTENEAVWMDTLMRHKYHLIDEHITPIRGGVVTFIAFNLIGFIPLAAYVFNPLFNMTDKQLFAWTAFFTLLALFIVGAVKARLLKQRWVWAGLETMFIGGIAASIAYLVGHLLRNIQ
jgi:VIT1/CCC1 family predicted Fe2+/Mn2+ transporter